MLTLDLVRHGPALPASPNGDAGRVLSPDGRSIVRRLAERLQKDGWAPLPAYVSPLVRARQTAEILATVVPGGLPMIVLPELAPDGDHETLLAMISPLLEPDSHTVCVGHQPLLGNLVAHLSGAAANLSAGQLVRLECPEPLDRGRARVIATFSPPHFR